VVAWLNCDEQYLPGTLETVASFFKTHSAVDLLFGGMLMVDCSGNFLACRKAMPMRRAFLEASYLYNYSCAMFMRSSLWKTLDGFDAAFRNAGDEELLRRAISGGAASAVLNEYLSVFTYAEDNLSSAGSALHEHERLKVLGGFAGRGLRLPVNLLRLAEKLLRGGCYQRGPLAYDVYVNRLDERVRFEVAHPTCRWPDAQMPYLMSHRLQ
jgi:hypothetical protein